MKFDFYLAHFFLMLPFDAPENITKSLVFSGIKIQKEGWEKMGQDE